MKNRHDLCFFFSSRRRHTRCSRDWSSDVCSSDLGVAAARQLLAAQIPAVVLEARPRVGGRAWTMREPSGMALDLGCGWLHSADENEWAALAPALGLHVDRTPPPWGGRRRTIAFPPAEREDFRAASERF